MKPSARILTAAVWACALALAATSAAASAAEGRGSDLRLTGGVWLGYDDNPAYDSTRDGDLLARQSVGLRARRRLSDAFSARASYQALNVNYFEATDQSVFGQRAGAGLDWLLDRDTAVEWDYVFRYAYFPDNSPVDFADHALRTGLARRLTGQTILRAGYTRAHRRYIERKGLDGSGGDSGDRRADDRHEVDASLAGEWSREWSWGTGVTWRVNDSNDFFHDFYDYQQWEPYAAVRLRVDALTTLTVRGSYQRREYGSRPLLDDASAAQEDDAWSASATLQRKLTDSVSLVAGYVYRQRDSNEPFQEYSGSITTLGLQAAF